MRKRIKLGVLTALIVLLAIAVPAWAGPPTPSTPSGGIELAHFDIYRTGTPDYDLVWQFYREFDVRNLEHLPRAGVARPDGYYWVIIVEEERDVIDEMVEEIQRIMGEDFPIAVSVSSPMPIDEATARALQDEFEKLIERDIYRTGTPDLDLVKESRELLRDVIRDVNLRHPRPAHDDRPYIVVTGVRIDGYYWVMIVEENWDVIHDVVEEIQRIMGEDFPIAVSVEEEIRRLGEVFAGHRCVIHTGS